MPTPPVSQGSDDPATHRDDVGALKRGDEGEWRRMMDRYTRPINAMLHARGHRDDAADVLQEIFIRASRGISKFDESSPLFSWLWRIALNESNRALASGARECAETLDDSVANPGPSMVDRRAFWDDLRRALARCRPADREAFIMRRIEGLTAKEAARQSGRSVPAIETATGRAEKALASLLADYHPDQFKGVGQ